jgi:transposase InsO family protein
MGQVSLKALCQVYGYSRQAYYKRQAAKERRQHNESDLLNQVHKIRADQPKVGGRKLYKALQPQHYGRDRFFEFLRMHGLLVKRRRGGRRTTYCGRTRFPNRIRNVPVTRTGQVLVSDITYLESEEGFCYLFLTTDLYSRKIIGWQLRRDLTATGSVYALEQAAAQIPGPQGTIHHSDRGWQYGAHEFRAVIETKGMHSSMTEEDHVYENAVAERINGILKHELGLRYRYPSWQQLYEAVRRAIHTYNNKRLHQSLGYITPAEMFKKGVNYSRT